MKCNQENLYNYIENKLEDEKAKMVEEHIKQCEKCTDILTTFNLMQSIGESNIPAPIDFAGNLMNKLDDNIYENKKYFFINRIIVNKRNIMRFASVAILALVILSAPLLNQRFNLIGNIKNNSIVKVDKEIASIPKFDIDENSKQFLLKYNYHISEKLSENQVTLSERFGFNLEVDACKEIGLDLEQYKNKEVKNVSYSLKEKSQDKFNGNVNAHLYYNDKNEIIGAFLSYEGYDPSIFPLNNRNNIRPENFNPATFKFVDVEKVEILGPADINNKNVWTERRTINSNYLEKFLSVLETSKPHNVAMKGKRSANNEYMICINYKDGTELRLYYYKDIDKIEIINLKDWYFETNDELKALVGTVDLTNQTESVSKGDLRNKIANSIDYFTSADGSFRWYEKRFNKDVTVDYKVKLKDNPSSYEKETAKDGTTTEATLSKNVKTIFYNSTKTYRTGEVSKIIEDTTKHNIENRYFTALDGNKGVYLRQDPTFMLFANESLFNQNLAVGVLENETKWSIAGIEKYLNLDAAVIEGTFDDYYSTKFGATKYKIWIEKHTGIILKMEHYSQGGETVSKLETSSINLNMPIDDKEMRKDTTGYTVVH